jgi:MFS family permease
VLPTLLLVTVLGTMCNNIVNVPLRLIADDFDQPLEAAVLCVSAFVLPLAIAMPLTGWLGDRIGQKRTLTLALVLMLVSQGLAALSPSLAVLVAMRGLQGLACSAIPPMVMGLLSGHFPGRHITMMGAWAAANGVGQAIGPPVGGVVSDALGWRAMFVLLAACCAVLVPLLRLGVPELPARQSRLHLPGALLLTAGVGLLLVAVTALSQRGVPGSAVASMGVAGALMLVGYCLVSSGRPNALIPVRLVLESRFMRSSVAAFAQMFTLGTVLVALPLFFTGPLSMSTSRAGLICFTLPVVMALAATLVIRLSARAGPRRVMRTGLIVIAAGTAATGLTTSWQPGRGTAPILVALLVVLGLGMAMVQTPAAAGATRSPAGQYGAAVGLFSMLRFSGSGTGAAWVALTYQHDGGLLLFGGCAVVALVGLIASFAGQDPTPTADSSEPTRVATLR